MKVFLSRPTFVPKIYESGVTRFVDMLRSHGLDPKTLGTTDYPTHDPLSEVIRLMDQCSGAIILGVPQISIVEGNVKGAPLSSPLTLATEWNHIEAGLAVARRLPILVVHHLGVSRGIFDRGAMAGFLYEKDFGKPEWPTDAEILGALVNFRGELAAPVKSVIKTGEQPTQPPADVNADMKAILKYLVDAKDAGQDYIVEEQISRDLSMSRSSTTLCLKRLRKLGFVGEILRVGGPVRWGVREQGIEYVLEKNTKN